jgi:hypothetical protein
MIGEVKAQVKGSKPNFKPNGKVSEITRQRVSELSEAYLEARNSKLRSQAFLAEAQAKEKAGELISRRLAGLQAAFLLGNFRSRVLAEPQSLARRLLQQGLIEQKTEHLVQQAIKEAFHGMLRELSELPSKVMNSGDSDWASKIDDDLKAQVDQADVRIDPSKARAQAEQAKIRRQKKTQTMRELRARGRIA